MMHETISTTWLTKVSEGWFEARGGVLKPGGSLVLNWCFLVVGLTNSLDQNKELSFLASLSSTPTPLPNTPWEICKSLSLNGPLWDEGSDIYFFLLILEFASDDLFPRSVEPWSWIAPFLGSKQFGSV